MIPRPGSSGALSPEDYYARLLANVRYDAAPAPQTLLTGGMAEAAVQKYQHERTQAECLIADAESAIACMPPGSERTMAAAKLAEAKANQRPDFLAHIIHTIREMSQAATSFAAAQVSLQAEREAERQRIRAELDKKWEKFKEGLDKELVAKGVDDTIRQEIAGTIEDIQKKAGTAKASEVKRAAEQLGNQVAPALGVVRAQQIEEDALKRAAAQREAVIEAKVAIGKYSVEDGQKRMNRHARGLGVDEVPEINAPGEKEVREPATNQLNPLHVDSNEIANTPSLAQTPLPSTQRERRI